MNKMRQVWAGVVAVVVLAAFPAVGGDFGHPGRGVQTDRRPLAWRRDDPGEEIALRIDQTLNQDSTGAMVMLELEASSVDRVQTELSA